MKTFRDITGQRFGRLTVIAPAGKSKNNTYLFECKCDCGAVVIKRGSHLKSGEVKSCGCFRKEDAKVRLKHQTHGHCSGGILTPEYKSWTAMMQRCYRENHPHYNQYGGRGITVCDEWRHSFEGFLKDMGERPAGMTLDRINNNLGYFPKNCRWATAKEQGNNRRNNKTLTLNGINRCMSDWANVTGIKYSTIRERLRRGWTIENALTISARKEAL